eukprot:7391182-Pyramimonas_sp.AAC.1
MEDAGDGWGVGLRTLAPPDDSLEIERTRTQTAPRPAVPPAAAVGYAGPRSLPQTAVVHGK